MLTFMAQPVHGIAAVVFDTTAPRNSRVELAGANVMGGLNGGTVDITPSILRLEFLLQGPGRPVPGGWIQEMQVALFQNDQEVLSTIATSSYDDVGGVGIVELANLAAGAYDIYIRAPRSLAKVEGDVVFSGGQDTIGVGPLLTGNGMQREDITSTSDIIDGTDFSILAGSFFKGEGDSGYDGRADYDGNLFIDGADFSLLASNFLVLGPQEVP